ncbi:MAG: sigma-54-dependent Fis family transcriptional regulator [Nitrospinota bacterium]|nr:MAG: sigma-54-dependent Fis family transcriptional regulator [Nitrospinota bacterium]
MERPGLKPRVVVIDDEEGIRRLFQRLLGKRYDLQTFERGLAALEDLQRTPADLVITDLKMPGIDGMEVLRRVKELDPDLPVIVLTAYGTVENAVEAMKKGAYDYITKPVQAEEMELVIEKALERRRLLLENRLLHRELQEKYSLGALIGKSPAMQQLFRLILTVAPTDATVLILGESGTGKELVAKAIYAHSLRKEKVFLSINCAAFPETLLESELFGYEKGAFTGASSTKKGLLEVADGGTLFLDEIGDMPLPLQSKVLRALESGEFLRLGGRTLMQVDVRVISSTNRPLKALMAEGKFREDLFYRLNTFTIELPPLRERREDIPLLAAHFLRQYATKAGKEIHGFTPETLEILLNYPWPGNVRQLEKAVERAVIMTRGELVEAHTLPAEVLQTAEKSLFKAEPLSFREARQRFERDYLITMLRRHRGNVTAAAEAAGIHRTHFYQKMRLYGISEAEYRNPDMMGEEEG